MADAADCNPQQPLLAESEEEQRLKYFEFVQVMALHALMCAAKLYSYAKENSGPLKPGVDTVEGTVKTVVGPVYDKYHGFPIEVLKFIDRKVDESVNKVQSRVPPTLKEVSTQAFETAQKAPAAARSVVTEVKNTGVVGTASGLAKTVYAKYEPAAKDLYTKYEPVAEQYVTSAWRQLNQLPLFPRVAQAVGPTASYCSEMYNQTVQQAAEKGYKVAAHLPLVPTERIARVLST
ncbi:REF/SRPP-like protein At3g05500 [Sesamum indicum]|uniref:REF/SRPP-like protein At3g05500 n=1 Tax=Sesamum indicum TaxID=4182 RepID=A0A6I9TXN9_SESIN|nr:REF/SRPP-like protein At3g05500 [Sesamum indicum]